jgi:hypothetical protein
MLPSGAEARGSSTGDSRSVVAAADERVAAARTLDDSFWVCISALPIRHGLDKSVTLRVGMPNGRSYNWALHLDATNVELTTLSPAALKGYWYACQLAEDALDRSRDPRRHEQQDPLTLQQIAGEEDLEPAQLARLIALARRQLFGTLTDAGIYKRLQRQKNRKPRRCSQPGCTTTIPVTAPANKTYCHQHASGAARVRRHRQHNTASPHGLGGFGHAGQNARDRRP